MAVLLSRGSNLPYVAHGDRETLAPELAHEPADALLLRLAEDSTSLPLITEEEILTGRNLPAATLDVLKKVGANVH